MLFKSLTLFALTTLLCVQGQTGKVFYNTIKAYNDQYVVPSKKIGEPLQLSIKPFTWTFYEQYDKADGTFGDIVQYSSSNEGDIDIIFNVDGTVITSTLSENVRHPFEFHPQGKTDSEFTITSTSYASNDKYFFECWEANEYEGVVVYNSKCNCDDPHPSQIFTLEEANP